MFPVVLQQFGIGAFPIVAIVVLLIAIVTIYNSVVIIDATEKGAYTRFGKYIGLLEPGPQLILPFVTNVHRFDMRTQTLDVPRQEAITRDNYPVTADTVVSIKVMDAQKTYLEVDNHKRAVSNLAQTTLRAVLGDMELEDALNKHQEINAKIRRELDEPTDEWGIRVESVEVKEVNPAKEDQQGRNQNDPEEKDVQQAREQRILETEFESPLTLTERHSQGPFMYYAGTHNDGAGQIRVISLNPDIDSAEAREAFISTIRSWRNGASHPNVVTIHDYGDSPRPWVVLPEAPGKATLADHYQNLSLSERVDILVDVSEALRNLDLYNAKHLNLSPECVWVRESGEKPDGVVDDWGLERSVHEALGETHVTPYTAPEQITDEYGIPSAQTDVYGLGAVTYYVVTEELPIAADSQTVRQGEITPPSEIADVPKALSDVITRALTTNPEDRYDSAYELGQALKTTI